MFAMKNDRYGINVVFGFQFNHVKKNKLTNTKMCSLVIYNNEFGTHSARAERNSKIDHRRVGYYICNLIDIGA